MDWVDLFWHVAGFAAPALVLAPAMVLIGQVFGKKVLQRCPGLRKQLSI